MTKLYNKNSTFSDIVIIGAGCVGQGLAASLLLSNKHNRIFLITSTRQLAKLQQHGIAITGVIEQTFKPDERLLILDHIDETAMQTFNLSSQAYVFIATKAIDAVTSLHSIKALLFHGKPTIITLQNGFGTEQAVKAAVQLFAAKVLKGQVISALQHKHQAVFAYSGRLIIESHPNSDNTLQHIFANQSALFSLQLTNNVLQEIYPKLVVNCVCNPLSVIFNKKLGFLRKNHEALIQAICQELYQLAIRLNLPFASCNMLTTTVFTTMENFPSHFSSMHADICSGKNTEIEEITGTALQLAKEKAYGMPINEFLKTSIKEIEHLRKNCFSSKAFYTKYAEFLRSLQRKLLTLAEEHNAKRKKVNL